MSTFKQQINKHHFLHSLPIHTIKKNKKNTLKIIFLHLQLNFEKKEKEKKTEKNATKSVPPRTFFE